MQGHGENLRLVEGVDYYIDRLGRVVFLAAYHRRRGTCCGNKCRNCPFDWQNVNAADIRPGEPRPPLDRDSIDERESA